MTQPFPVTKAKFLLNREKIERVLSIPPSDLRPSVGDRSRLERVRDGAVLKVEDEKGRVFYLVKNEIVTRSGDKIILFYAPHFKLAKNLKKKSLLQIFVFVFPLDEEIMEDLERRATPILEEELISPKEKIWVRDGIYLTIENGIKLLIK